MLRYYYQWIVWAAFTIAWNATNTCNSRAKNSTNLQYNALTTFGASAMYLGSMMWIIRRPGSSVVSVLIYATLSVIGSVMGQFIALWIERKRNSHFRRTS